MRPFTELQVWKQSHSLTLSVHDVTRGFPREEIYGLTSQMRRAASSVPMNIAEGSARGDQEFAQFLRIALGSAAELEYQLILTRDLSYIDSETYNDLNARLRNIKRMLVTFRTRLLSTTLRPSALPASLATANG